VSRESRRRREANRNFQYITGTIPYKLPNGLCLLPGAERVVMGDGEVERLVIEVCEKLLNAVAAQGGGNAAVGLRVKGQQLGLVLMARPVNEGGGLPQIGVAFTPEDVSRNSNAPAVRQLLEHYMRRPGFWPA
jgi:hypothetical protein